jgi:hypothetical protein
MVSASKFKVTMLEFKEFFDYIKGFRDLMMFDSLEDFKIEGNIITFYFVNKDKLVEFPLNFGTMKQSYEEWLKEKKE